ncbi:MNIO family bufferin maturase [Balneatrix alpica]|uniref:MNIO family bufferin maturase n=1 Tax=Balneatrix alpica TaxID=75684 RepID=UPI00273978E8|nr:DUF692 domain-containing protein [Balneatrix alpica]
MLTTLPLAVGVGLRAPHYPDFLEQRPPIAWLEAHSENYFGGGAALQTLMRIAAHYPISLHGVGMGLASAQELDPEHLQALCKLVQRIQPQAVSEHLSWCRAEGQVINDLLPFPYSEEALLLVTDRVQRVQDALRRPLLIENLSAYLRFADSVLTEAEFLAELVQRTGCGLLLDINNLYVNQVNLGVDAQQEIARLPAAAIAEIHLAGFSQRNGCLVDSHSRAVVDEVWQLYAATLAQIGPRPTLIEWDLDIPSLDVLLGEADKAAAILRRLP